MTDETPEENNDNEQELFNALGAEMGNSAAGNESWILLNETYQGLQAGGFSKNEALTLLTNIMWKMMIEGTGD